MGCFRLKNKNDFYFWEYLAIILVKMNTEFLQEYKDELNTALLNLQRKLVKSSINEENELLLNFLERHPEHHMVMYETDDEIQFAERIFKQTKKRICEKYIAQRTEFISQYGELCADILERANSHNYDCVPVLK